MSKQQEFYVVGHYCPRGSGHYEMFSDPEYEGDCSWRGWPVVLHGASRQDGRLPDGMWLSAEELGEGVDFFRVRVNG